MRALSSKLLIGLLFCSVFILAEEQFPSAQQLAPAATSLKVYPVVTKTLKLVVCARLGAKVESGSWRKSQFYSYRDAIRSLSSKP